MIQVDGLSIAYHGIPLFNEATFSIQEGERCGLVGRNGSGKSTLFKLITGKETPNAGTISTRKDYIIGALDQHIDFKSPTIIQEAALGLRPADQDHIYKAERILFGLGFKDEDLERSPKDFSGGYQLRLHLAKVLIGEPDCLLLDEPTNYLDIVSIRWFTRFLQQWKGEFVLISHDREFMDNVSTHTMGIHRQKVRKIKGDTVAFYNQIVQEEEVHEKTRQNMEKKRAHAQDFIDRFGAKAAKAAQAQSRAKMLGRIPTLEKLKAIYHLDFSFNEAPFHGKKMVDAQNASFAYSKDAEVPLIDDLSLCIEKGERVAIIGKNGRGKSTILRLLSNDLEPNSGNIKISENVRLGYFGQTNIDRLHPKQRVEDEIASANPKLSRTQVKAICGVMMFSGTQAEKTTAMLSGGERSRVLLGKILASPCNLLLLDEPTHHLDMESIEALIDALEEFEGAIILVTHSELILKRIALDKIVVCRQGEQELFLGNYDDFLEKDGWHDASDKPKGKAKSGGLPDLKQKRAERVAARSKELKPVENQIGQKEKVITKLEIDQQEALVKLTDLTLSGISSVIQDLSKEISARKNNLESLYSQLESLMEKREEIERKYDEE